LEILSSEVLIDLVESNLVIGTPGLLDFIAILTAIELLEESVQKTLIRDLAFDFVEKSPRLQNSSCLSCVYSLCQVPLTEDSKPIREKFYTILGNLASEGVFVRDSIFTQLQGLVPMMLIDVTISVKMAEQIMWVLSNLMKEEPLPDKNIVSFI
jgi:hypothetical protein